jgi:hypothetical protein
MLGPTKFLIPQIDNDVKYVDIPCYVFIGRCPMLMDCAPSGLYVYCVSCEVVSQIIVMIFTRFGHCAPDQ